MTPLLAQTDQTILSIGMKEALLAVAVLVIFQAAMKFTNGFWSSVTRNVTRQQRTDAEPKDVKVQSPVHIAAHPVYLAKSEYDEDLREFKRGMENLRAEQKHTSEKLAGLTATVASTNKQLATLNTNVTDILSTMPR
jgi:septal ring factor EnvC (AmiA/AmiB activator)